MRGVFNQQAVVGGYLAAGLRLNQALGGLDHAQVGVHAAAIVEPAQTVARPREQGREIVIGGCEHPGARLAIARWPLVFGARMAVQAAQALEQHIHGTQVGDEQVGIDVQALLQCLRANNDAPLSVAPRFAELRFDRLVEQGTVLATVPAVVNGADTVDFEQPIATLRCVQLLQRF